jgi:hypothetical protein
MHRKTKRFASTLRRAGRTGKWGKAKKQDLRLQKVFRGTEIGLPGTMFVVHGHWGVCVSLRICIVGKDCSYSIHPFSITSKYLTAVLPHLKSGVHYCYVVDSKKPEIRSNTLRVTYLNKCTRINK